MFRYFQRFSSLLVLLLVGSCGDATGVGDSGGGTSNPPAALSAVTGNGQDAAVGSRLPVALVVEVRDAKGAPLSGVPVAWSVAMGEGSLTAQASSTDASGRAQVEWTLGTKAGENLATATVGALPPVLFRADGRSGDAASIQKVKGDAQTGMAGATLPDSLVVQVLDAHGNPVRGRAVAWSVQSGGGALSGTASTDDQGRAGAAWTTGTAMGANVATASLDERLSVAFSATTTAGAATKLDRVDGDAQTALVSSALPKPLVVKVTDANGNPVAGTSVTWTVRDGGGSITPAIAVSDSAGVASAVWTLGAVAGANGATASAAGRVLEFTATATARPVVGLAKTGGDGQSGAAGAALGSPLVVRLTDAGGVPVGGATVTWRVTGGGGSISPASVVSAADGTARATWTLGTAAGANSVAASVGGLTATFAATGTPGPVATIVVEPSTSSVQVGKSVQLSATAKDSHGNVVSGRTISWFSSSPVVATVSQTGLVQGNSAGGPVTITAASIADGGKSGTATVTVTGVPAATLELPFTERTFETGEKFQFASTVRDANGNWLTDRAVTHTTSDPAVLAITRTSPATVELTAVGPGTATITATVEGLTKTATVTVTRAATPVGGILGGNTTWTLAASPYRLTSTVQVAPGATLTIEPGVLIYGGGKSLEIFGALNAVGTAGSRIVFDAVQIGARGSASAPSAIVVEYARISGSIYGAFGGAGYGSLRLRHSILSGADYIYLWYPTSDSYIEYNVFDNTGGISVGAGAGRKVYIRHNSFYTLTTTNYAVQSWANYDGAGTIVEGNSFLRTDRVAVRLPSGYSSATMVATGNYWGTTDEATIQSMIHDRNDDLGSAGVIEFRPYLTAPHPATPTR